MPVRAAAPAFYTVQPGDSLSAIAQKLFGSQDKWPYLYSANLKVVGSDPNLITPGMKLSARLASTPAYGQQQSFGGGTAVLASSSVSSAGNQPDPAPAYQAPVQPQVQSGGYNGGTPGGSFGACVVARESGGNAQVMNSSGHYGLYQFSAVHLGSLRRFRVELRECQCEPAGAGVCQRYGRWGPVQLVAIRRLLMQRSIP